MMSLTVSRLRELVGPFSHFLKWSVLMPVFTLSIFTLILVAHAMLIQNSFFVGSSGIGENFNLVDNI